MSFRSPFPDVDIPASSVYDFLFGSLDESELDRPALIDGASGTVTDYRTLVAHIDAHRGLTPNETRPMYVDLERTHFFETGDEGKQLSTAPAAA